MVKKYVFGSPFETEAIVQKITASQGVPAYGEICLEDGFCFTYRMEKEDIVYGLGEANRGINKRGYRYVSSCLDTPDHTEDLISMYGAHNFIVVDGSRTFGLFVDYPADLVFDVGYTVQDRLVISCERADLDLYVIEEESAYEIVRRFRAMIGRSYIAPRFAFGYGQSRWGYKTPEDFREVVKRHRENHIPLDMVYMDIDYMQDYKDFTVHEDFGDFKAYVEEMRKQKIHLIPIIDAGVKVQEGYDVYEEGRENGYFCKRADGSDFTATVWPGFTHFPDVLNADARAWFGEKYKILLDAGIDGFWNDMNEPAIFYSEEGLAEFRQYYDTEVKDVRETDAFTLTGRVLKLANDPENYKRFYHNVNGQQVRHDRVHNLYGYNMTRAAGEAFERLCPDRRILLFSRSSYIGMHRYGGIWTGDNKSWWSHILLNLKMLPSLNMCGFLYIGADLGGFGADTTRDLLLRWLALGVFTPLMRNHSATGTRRQEVYQFEDLEDFRHVIGVRYRLIPYLYSEYMKAALNGDMMFSPLAFVWSNDQMARETEDQILLGRELMIAPVYTQNASGRYVYLPEEMMFVKFLPNGAISEEILQKGHHYVRVAPNEVPLFIRKGKGIPIADPAETVEDIDLSSLKLIGYPGADYELYEDDGTSRVG